MIEHVRIPLYTRDGSVCAHTLVDATDAARVGDHRWSLKAGYAARNVGPASARRTILMHRVLLGLEPGDPREGDHRNRDRLDNRRANLRIGTHAQNQQNLPAHRTSTSQYRGVTWASHQRRWRAQVVLNGHRHHLGYSTSEIDAANAAAAFRDEHMPYALPRETERTAA